MLNRPRFRSAAILPSLSFSSHVARRFAYSAGAILRRLRNRLVFSYHLTPDRIALETPLAQDLDSLDVVELVMALEEELGVKIFDKEAEKIKTVEDVVRLVRRQSSG